MSNQQFDQKLIPICRSIWERPSSYLEADLVNLKRIGYRPERKYTETSGRDPPLFLKRIGRTVKRLDIDDKNVSPQPSMEVSLILKRTGRSIKPFGYRLSKCSAATLYEVSLILKRTGRAVKCLDIDYQNVSPQPSMRYL